MTHTPGTEADADRERRILDHVSLLKHLVGRMAFDSPHVDRDDLYGFGMLGLIAAADSWDASRGLQFSTYAYARIRGAILDELRKADFLPRGRREKVRAMDAVVSRLTQRNGLPPSPEEIAEELGVDLLEVDEVLSSAASAVQASLDDGPEESLAALVSDPRSPDPVGSVEWNELRGVLAEEITELSDQEQTVITLYYAEELLLREIAEVLGVTESRVSQIHSRALARLNRALAARTGCEDPRG